MQGFITSVGNRDRRVRLALQSSFAPVVHATLTSLVAVIMLSTSPFEFIVHHFFWLLLAVMIIGIVNGLFFFPILLSLIGPAAELVPLEYPDRISTPSPPTYRQKRTKTGSSNRHSTNSTSSRSCNKSHHHHKQHINNNETPPLTTITEEPQSWKSSSSSMSSGSMQEQQQQQHSTIHSNQSHNQNYNQACGPHIVVQPEVIVETTQNGNDSNTTKVTATANIKVELVAPGRMSRSYSYNTSQAQC